MSQIIRSKRFVIYFSIMLVLILLLIGRCWLGLLNIPLKIQQNALNKQLHQIRVLQSLPDKWEHQTRLMDIAELMGLLSKNWHELMPKFKDIELEEESRNQLRAKVVKVEEQAFMQWLWAMQQQYAFKIVKLNINPSGQSTIIDAQFSLQLL